MCNCNKCVCGRWWALGEKFRLCPVELLPLIVCLFLTWRQLGRGYLIINILLYIFCIWNSVFAPTTVLVRNTVMLFVCNCSLLSSLRTMWVSRPSTRLLVRAVWSVSTLSWFRERKLSKSCDQICVFISFPLYYSTSKLHLCKGSPPNSKRSRDEIWNARFRCDFYSVANKRVRWSAD